MKGYRSLRDLCAQRGRNSQKRVWVVHFRPANMGIFLLGIPTLQLLHCHEGTVIRLSPCVAMFVKLLGR